MDLLENSAEYGSFDTESIIQALNTEYVGQVLRYHKQIPSSNDFARDLCRSKQAIHGMAILADSQTKGRGRYDRAWFSPPGRNIYVSIITECGGIDTSKLGLLTLVAAVALVDAIGSSTGVNAGIKWPNDLLITGKKLAGILCEGVFQNPAQPFVITGIGLNVNMMQSEISGEIAKSATSLQIVSGQPQNRVQILHDLFTEFEKWFECFREEKYAEIISYWKKNSVSLGKWIQIKASDKSGIQEGIFHDIDCDGAALIQDDMGQMNRVFTGEILG